MSEEKKPSGLQTGNPFGTVTFGTTPPKCICGAALKLMTVKRCCDEYKCGAVHCDICRRLVDSTQQVYHCTQGKSYCHAHGYDVCQLCARCITCVSSTQQNNSHNSNDNAIYSDMLDVHDDDAADNAPPKCICGAVLKLMTAKRCCDEYQCGAVYCDICRRTVDSTQQVYHCTEGKSKCHAQGYDVCQLCASRKTNDFVTDLLLATQQHQGNGENVVISPFSISAALSLALCGANNNTLKQMINVLLPNHTDYELTFDYARKITANYINICQQYSNQYRGIVTIANRLWISSKFQPFKQYLDACNVNLAPINCANPQMAADKVNAWCGDQTKGMIKEIVKPSDLPPDTRMLITNAIYFNGKFEQAFPIGNTQQNTAFYATAQRTKCVSRVSMMSSTLRHFFAKNIYNGQFDAVKLFYKGCKRGLSLILIKNNAVNYKGGKGSDFGVQDIQNITFNQQELELYVPKFEFCADYKMNKILQSLGMVDAFMGKADFSNMADEAVFIADVLHKAFIKVDETGTKAAAVTAIAYSFGCGPSQRIPVIRFDHAFNFYLMEETKQHVLFSGSFTK